MKARRFAAWLIASIALASSLKLTGCGSQQAAPPAPLPPSPQPSPPAVLAPVLDSISPSSAIAGTASFTATLVGSNFTSDSQVLWQGRAPLAVNFVSSSKLTFTVTSDLTTCPRCYSDTGTVQVQVIKPVSPNTTLFSNAVAFSLSYPQPSVASLSPSHVQAGAAPLLVALNGSGFVSDDSGSRSAVNWNGTLRPATVVSSSQMTAQLAAADVSSPETAQVTVTNPTPGGGVSPAISFLVDPLTSNPLPAISSLSDTAAPAGWPGFPLTVVGTGFVAATGGNWNGLERDTTVLNETQLKSAIPATDLAASGTAQVTVSNPSPGGGTSNAVSFNIKSVAPGTVGVIERSSVATSLAESNNSSRNPAITADARWVVFVSDANNLVDGDTNGVTDAFLRDTCLGTTGCVPKLVRVSVASDSTQANAATTDAAISANGRFVAFSSRASNLVSGVTSGRSNVFLRDTCFGAAGTCMPSTTIVSSDTNDSFAPALSADGRYVAFANGVIGDCYYYYGCSPNNLLAQLHDTCAGAPSGCTPSTNVVSLANDGSLPHDTNADPHPLISADGRFVAFRSSDSSLLSDAGGAGIFLRDTCNGASGCTPSTIRAAAGSNGPIPVGTLVDFTLSGNGRFLGFTTNAAVTSSTPSAFSQVFVRDTCAGVSSGCTSSTSAISLASDGTAANGDSHISSMSPDGRYVAFTSEGTNLIAGDTSPFPKIFLHDTCLGASSGCVSSNTRLSVSLDGTPANNQCAAPQLNGDSRYVVFSSLASNLAPGDTNQVTDVFVARTNVP